MVATWTVGTNLLLWGLELYFAAMLGVSGLSKIAYPEYFAVTLRRHHILPERMISPLSTIIPWSQIATSVLLVIGIIPTITALLTLGLFASFLIVEMILVITKRTGECGCYGLAFSATVDGASLTASGLLTAMAAFHLWATAQVKPVGVEWRIIGLALLGSMGCWLLWKALKLRSMRSHPTIFSQKSVLA